MLFNAKQRGGAAEAATEAAAGAEAKFGAKVESEAKSGGKAGVKAAAGAEAEAAKASKKAKSPGKLSPRAAGTVGELEKAQDYLKAKMYLADRLSACARAKRIADNIRPGYKIFAGILVLLSLGSLGFGLYAAAAHNGMYMHFLLIGAALLIYALSLRVLPIGSRSPKKAQQDMDDAVKNMDEYISAYPGKFPLPARYAHPIVLLRMQRIIKEGRAETLMESYELMKAELKAADSTVRVSQAEYNEITAVKPLFLVFGYKDSDTGDKKQI